jgi:hypothetical protein
MSRGKVKKGARVMAHDVSNDNQTPLRPACAGVTKINNLLTNRFERLASPSEVR